MKTAAQITVGLEDTIRRQIRMIEDSLRANTFVRFGDVDGSRRWYQGQLEALKWVLERAGLLRETR